MQHDTSPHELELGGRKRKVQTASAVLCYSRMLFFQCAPGTGRNGYCWAKAAEPAPASSENITVHDASAFWPARDKTEGNLSIANIDIQQSEYSRPVSALLAYAQTDTGLSLKRK
jgi:hypothetical protein